MRVGGFTRAPSSFVNRSFDRYDAHGVCRPQWLVGETEFWSSVAVTLRIVVGVWRRGYEIRGNSFVQSVQACFRFTVVLTTGGKCDAKDAYRTLYAVVTGKVTLRLPPNRGSLNTLSRPSIRGRLSSPTRVWHRRRTFRPFMGVRCFRVPGSAAGQSDEIHVSRFRR